MHAQTTGWVGMGISPNGAMTGADIVLGWVKGQTTILSVSRKIIFYGNNLV